MFLRLNTGGENLKPQEIRNVAFDGDFNHLLYELSENPFLKQKMNIVNDKSPAFRKMEDLEHILRFFTLSSSYQTMSGVLTKAMDQFMNANRNLTQEQLDIFRQTFNRTIESCNLLWPEVAFNKPVANNQWRTQLISPLYDAEMVAVTLLINNQIQQLSQIPNQVIQMTRNLFENNDVFTMAVTQATNNRTNIVARIEIMRDSLIELI